jgi:ribosomal protein S18 acetylase RimI-like enzyme
VLNPRRASDARRTDLEELLALLRKDLVRRDEAPGGDWLETATAELASGAKPGFYLPPSGPGGLAFFSRRGAMAFGHLHTEPGPDAIARGTALGEALLASLPGDVTAIDIGFTGLAAEDERALGDALARRPGATVIGRQAFERTLGPEDALRPAEPPVGVERLPLREVTVEALADLDRRAFSGTVDALLVGPAPGDYQRAVEAILGDELGRFLDEASGALVVHDPVRLVGAIYTAEKSSRLGIFLDIAVDPDERRRGLGRYLLGWGLRALWALGHERARLWVTDANTAARALYADFGFRPVGRATIYRWDRPDSAGQPQRAR